jgi:acyl-CoA thioester hydrolase
MNKFEAKVEIRFADIDAMGHVNNATYFTYFEQARMSFFRAKIGKNWNWETDGLIVARNEIDYKKPVLLQDDMSILLWVDQVGTKSFTVCYEVMVGETLCANGKSVLVAFNHHLRQTQEIPSLWKEAFI